MSHQGVVVGDYMAAVLQSGDSTIKVHDLWWLSTHLWTPHGEERADY